MVKNSKKRFNNRSIEVYKVKDKYKGRISWAKNNDKRYPVGYIT